MNVAQYFDHWNIVHRDLIRAVAMLEDTDLSFQPSKHYPRSIGDILQHMINQQEGWIHFVNFRELPTWLEEDQRHLDNIASLRERLDKVFVETMRLLSTIPIEDLIRVIQTPGNGAL